MKLLVVLEPEETGGFSVHCPAIPGCHSQGETEEEALQNITEAIQLCLEVRAEEGLPLTVPTKTYEIEVPAWRLPRNALLGKLGRPFFVIPAKAGIQEA